MTTGDTDVSWLKVCSLNDVVPQIALGFSFGGLNSPSIGGEGSQYRGHGSYLSMLFRVVYAGIIECFFCFLNMKEGCFALIALVCG